MSVSQKSLLAKLQEHTTRFHPVVPFDPEQDVLLRMDFTAANKKVSEDILLNTDAFSRYVNNLLHAHHCRYGIGGYNEHRAIYSRSNVFDAGDSNEEPRRLHLGIDIWGKAGTPVFAPLNGNVHSFAFND